MPLSNPVIRLVVWLVIFGWILIIGGAVEAIDLILNATGTLGALLLSLLQGPAVHIGLGLALLALVELLRSRRA